MADKINIFLVGASSGLGQAILKRLSLRSDSQVFAGYLTPPGESSLNSLQIDITNPESCRNSISKIPSLDVVINCAGVTNSGPGLGISLDQLHQLFAVNFFGAVNLLQAAAPALQARSGKFIQITSLNGLVALPSFAAYSASKFALEAWFTALRIELDPSIRITTVAPGAISQSGSTLPLAHPPLRQRLPIVGKLLPIITVDSVAARIEDIVFTAHPPGRVVLGRDAQMAYFLSRLLPGRWFDRLQSYLWHVKK